MADLRKEELFPADAIGLFYLQITRIPGGWHRHAEYEIFYHMHSKIPSEISDSTVRALRGFCVSRNGDQISFRRASFLLLLLRRGTTGWI